MFLSLLATLIVEAPKWDLLKSLLLYSITLFNGIIFINSNLLARQLNGATGSVSIDLSKPIADIRSKGVSDVDYSATALNSGFVAEGNTGGLTPTTFYDFGLFGP